LFEAGHAAQNVCLLATELDLGSICTGGLTTGG
jgi:nitroreductase